MLDGAARRRLTRSHAGERGNLFICAPCDKLYEASDRRECKGEAGRPRGQPDSIRQELITFLDLTSSLIPSPHFIPFPSTFSLFPFPLLFFYFLFISSAAAPARAQRDDAISAVLTPRPNSALTPWNTGGEVIRPFATSRTDESAGGVSPNKVTPAQEKEKRALDPLSPWCLPHRPSNSRPPPRSSLPHEKRASEK
jgi:hypothetical protein